MMPRIWPCVVFIHIESMKQIHRAEHCFASLHIYTNINQFHGEEKCLAASKKSFSRSFIFSGADWTKEWNLWDFYSKGYRKEKIHIHHNLNAPSKMNPKFRVSLPECWLLLVARRCFQSDEKRNPKNPMMKLLSTWSLVKDTHRLFFEYSTSQRLFILINPTLLLQTYGNTKRSRRSFFEPKKKLLFLHFNPIKILVNHWDIKTNLKIQSALMISFDSTLITNISHTSSNICLSVAFDNFTDFFFYSSFTSRPRSNRWQTISYS